jgi:molybdopterin molybdotransferase
VVGIISSGDEVIPPDKTPFPGQVRDINSITLRLLVEQAGGVARNYGIAADNPLALQSLAEHALKECDMLLITAGSSTSHRDLTSSIIQDLGNPGVLVHGVNLRPGKPTILAVCGNKPVVGLPGNPVSALVVASLFVKPAIHHLLGIGKELPTPHILCRLATNVPSIAGREDWVPVIVSKSSSELIAEPIFFKSNLIFNLASADGLIRIPPDATGLPAGELVEVIIEQ